MTHAFFTVLGMSGTGALVILVVLLARLLLRRAPKVCSYALWAVVLFRLLCPFSIEGGFALVPTVEVKLRELSQYAVKVDLDHGRVTFGVNDKAFLPEQDLETDPAVSVPPGFDLPDDQTSDYSSVTRIHLTRAAVLALVWLAGAAFLLGYSVVSMLRLRRRLVGAVPLEGEKGVWLADHIPSPFVLGVFRPRIYLPSELPAGERDYILLHERTHIRRFDHIFRALAWLALAVHWFNPLVWAAFHLAGRDMEMSCDEAVLSRMGGNIRADYSTSLLRLSQGGKLPAGPLAFGDGDPRGRIRNILRWKKPALWVVAAGMLLVLTMCVALATDRALVADSPEPPPFEYHEPGPAEVWVDYLDRPEELPWEGSVEFQLPEYPGVTFRCSPMELSAVTDSDDPMMMSGALLSGMPIWNVYACDLDGDGCRELYVTANVGSGLIDSRIRMFNYRYLSFGDLEDRGVYDYSLRLEGDRLWAVERDHSSGNVTREGPLVMTEHWLDISTQGGGLNLPSSDLSLTIDGDVVRIQGSVGKVPLSRTNWFPPDGEYPLGQLWMEYPLLEG